MEGSSLASASYNDLLQCICVNVFVSVFVSVFLSVTGGQQLGCDIVTMIFSTVCSVNFTCNSVEVDKADALKSWVCKVLILATPCLEKLPDFKL